MRDRAHIKSSNWWPDALEMYRRNEKVEEIAQRFKVTASAVYMAINRGRRQVWKPNVSDMTVIEAFFMFPHDSIKELAARLNLTDEEVEKQLNARKIPYRRKHDGETS